MCRKELEDVHADNLPTGGLLGGTGVGDVVRRDGFGRVQEGSYAGGVERDVEG
jgi:hypothetical protein